MSDMTIHQFCNTHSACAEGRDWAVANCSSMQDAWEKLNPEWLLWVATRTGVLTDRELRLFAVWCARQVQHLMSDPRSVDAIDVAERYADGKATDDELAAAKDAAWAAALAVAKDAAWAAAKEAAWAAAKEAALAVAKEAAWAAAKEAALAVAKDAALAVAKDAAWAAAWAAQADWLRKNCKPNFKEAKL